MKKYFLLILLISHSFVYSQLLSISGKVTDKLSGEELSYANIRIKGTNLGTAANSEGSFQIKLKPGHYTVITSFIGYKSDTSQINLSQDVFLNISLEPISISLSEITILPGINPANEIIKRAIEFKHERERKLNSYVFHAYTKVLIKTTKDIVSTDRSVGISVSEKDTGKLKITGIIENESKGYFKKPNEYKDEIIARKQTANTPPTINILTGGRVLQNFYSNDIRFYNRPLSSPIADDALSFYYYIIEDTLAIDNHNVFKIYFEPIDKSDPGFYGDIYLIDSLFALVKLDVQLNDAANPGKIFDKINVSQQFIPFDNDIYMPIDYRLFVEGNFLGLVKFGFEVNSILYDYKINSEINDSLFDMAVIKVLPDADKKDSLYWKSNQTIPNTLEEIAAYKRIDSLEAAHRSFWDNNSFISDRWYLSDKFSFTAPLGIYSFNRITGHSLNFGLYLSDEFEKRFNSELKFCYGFSDKKFQSDFSLKYLLGEYRTGAISLSIFNKLTDLFGTNIPYNKFTSTISSLIYKYDFRDYYYTKGWTIKISEEIFPVLKLGIGFINLTDNSAYNNSNFSIFYISRKYNTNKLIYESKINALTASFTLDFRNYIEDGYYRQRVNLGKAYAILSGEAILSNRAKLKSNIDFQFYQTILSGSIPTYKSTSFSYRLQNLYSEGTVPFQMMYALSGNIDNLGKQFTFRTIHLSEVFGDRGVILNTQMNFNDEIFRFLKIPYIKDAQLILSCHFNAALISISQKSKSILNQPYKEFKRPFYELGFGIGQMLIPLSLEFTWRLNYREKNNFVFSINALLL